MSFSPALLHENEGLIAWVQTVPGRIALWCVVAILLLWHESSLIMLAAFSAVMLYPARRRLFLTVAAAGMIANRFLEMPTIALPAMPSLQWLLVVVLVAVVLGLFYVAYFLAQRFQQWPAIAQPSPSVTVASASRVRDLKNQPAVEIPCNLTCALLPKSTVFDQEL